MVCRIREKGMTLKAALLKAGVKEPDICPPCPYCESDAELVTGDEIYANRPDLSSLYFWACSPCDAFVGAHKKGHEPLGTLANKPLRVARKDAHQLFDTLWKEKHVSRNQAYALLQAHLSLSPQRCHIALFDIQLCRDTMDFVSDYLEPASHKPC